VNSGVRGPILLHHDDARPYTCSHPRPGRCSRSRRRIQAAAPAPADGSKPLITIDDFLKLDLRVAKIVNAEPHPNADKLWKLQLDDGSGTPRQICAGIREYYTAEQLLGQRIIIVANLAPRMLRGEESRGMLLAASNVGKDAPADVKREVIILTTLSDIKAGAAVG
jgi:methionyl-tRNA synthetase